MTTRRSSRPGLPRSVLLLAPLLLGAGGLLVACSEDPASADSPKAGPATDTGSTDPDPASDPDGPRRGGTHTLNFGGTQPETLNNILRSATRATVICRDYLFPPLLDVDAYSLELVPELAESRPEMLDGGRRWRWKLREGVHWHRGLPDGTPMEVTTADVEFSWGMIFDKGVMARHVAGLLDRFQDLKVIDRHTFEVTVDPPYFRAEYDFGNEFRMMPAHLAAPDPAAFNEDPLGREPVGYGPYRFDSWVDGQSLTLVRHRDYWDHTRRPFHIERIRFVFVADHEKAMPMFLRGDLSLSTVNNPEQWELNQQKPEYQEAATFHEYFLPRINFVGWNHRRPWFQDVRVRRALAHLCPRETMVRDFYRGYAQVVSGPWAWDSLEYDTSIAPLPHDPEQARALLDEAGWVDGDGDGVRDRDGQPFRFELLRQSGAVASIDPCILLYQQELKKVGIQMDIVPLNIREVIKKAREGDCDAFFLGWSYDPRDMDLYTTLHSSQAGGGDNYVAYSSPAMDELLTSYRNEMDEAKRRVMASRIHRQFQEDQPFLLFPTPQSLVMVSSKYRNVEISKRGAHIYRWWIADE